ncbi:MAG: hypothetical protein U9O53_03670, partial [archaeon]|nr:hypothetical protein [archaeon]
SIFGLVKNNSKKTIQINIDLDKINKTMKKQIEHFFKGKKKQKTTITTIKTEVIHNSIIHTSKNLLDNPKLYLKIYKIK